MVKATDEGAAAFGPTAGRSAVRFGVTARVLAMLTALALAVIGTSVIAISAFSWLKDSFDNVATTQLHTIRLASDLKQRAESLAGMAPSLFAGDLNREALIKYSMTSYSEQLKLDGLLKELGGHSLAGIEQAGGAKDKFFANLDELAMVLLDSASLRDDLDGNLRSIAATSQGCFRRTSTAKRWRYSRRK